MYRNGIGGPALIYAGVSAKKISDYMRSYGLSRRSDKVAAVLIAAVLLGGQTLRAQHALMRHGSETAMEIKSPEDLPTPVKMAGIGNASMKIRSRERRGEGMVYAGAQSTSRLLGL